MLARLLAVGDDVDAAVLLELEREQRRIELAGREIGAGKPPLRPELIRLGEPGGFGQRARDGGRKHLSGSRLGPLAYSSSPRGPGSSSLRATLPGGAVRQS